MKRIVLGALAVLVLAAVGCGGGGGDGNNSCSDLAKKVNDCIVSLGGSSDEPSIKASCDATVCTGSKQAAIDCVMGLSCNASMETAAMACLTDHGCTTPM